MIISEKNSLKDIAYQTIKSKIISCEYPPNEFLNESVISDEIGVSRTPIREALNKLEQENLVRIYPKRGVLVTDVSLAEVNEIFQVRYIVEPSILLTYAQNIDRVLLINIKEQLLFKGISPDDIKYKIDEDTHRLIVNSSNNRYFSSLMENIYDQNHRLRVIAGKKIEKRLQATNQEHLAIIESLLDRNWEGAVDAMKKHLENSKNAAIEGLIVK